jgi:hypothetical protein
MDDNERKALTEDLQALFTELRRLGWLEGYLPAAGDPELPRPTSQTQ